MSKITSDLLTALAPATKPATLRDRFLPFFNEALPRYSITTELRVSAFLATVIFESNYLRATKEGRAKVGTNARRAQDKYWASGYYGRGPIQITHLENYTAFNTFIHKSHPDAPDFVKHPEALEQLEWGVEAACWFWQRNKMNPLADKGKFFAIQGLTNRGDAEKEAWGYDDRLKIYEKCLRTLPDDFTLEVSPIAITKEPTDSTTTPLKPNTLQTEPPSQIANTIINSGDTKPLLDVSDNVKVQVQKPSLMSTLVALGTAIAGFVTFVKTNFDAAYDKAIDALDGKFVLYTVGSIGIILIGLWIFNESRKRAAEQTKQLVDKAAASDQHTVELKQ